MKKKNDQEMSFLDHLEELRWHIIRSVGAMLVGAVVAFLNKDFVWNKIIFAPKNADFITYRFFCNLSPTLCFGPDNIEIFTRDFGEQFMMHFVSSFWIGLIIAFPYIIWEVWRFVKPGLYKKEQKAIRGVVAICSILFFIGVLFGYFVIAPFGISFLSNYEIAKGIENTVSLDSYVNYMTMFILPLGLVFELPIIVYFLAKVGIVDAPMLRSFRRHAIVVIIILAAIITPPDVVSQILVSLPLIMLYEVSILIAARTNRTNAGDDDDDDDDDDKPDDKKDEYDYDESKAD